MNCWNFEAPTDAAAPDMLGIFEEMWKSWGKRLVVLDGDFRVKACRTPTNKTAEALKALNAFENCSISPYAVASGNSSNLAGRSLGL
jgi:hypothetical protein